MSVNYINSDAEHEKSRSAVRGLIRPIFPLRNWSADCPAFFGLQRQSSVFLWREKLPSRAYSGTLSRRAYRPWGRSVPKSLHSERSEASPAQDRGYLLPCFYRFSYVFLIILMVYLDVSIVLPVIFILYPRPDIMPSQDGVL